MKMKMFTVPIVLLLLVSGMLVAVRGDATESKENIVGEGVESEAESSASSDLRYHRSGYDENNTPHSSNNTNYEVGNILDENTQKKISSISEEERIEVVIRLSPYKTAEFEGTRYIESNKSGTEYMSEVKDHTKEKQSNVIEFLENSDGEVINSFWIANAILAEVKVDKLDELARHEDVWKIHENFEVKIDSNEDIQGFSYTPQDTTFENQNATWGLERIKATDVWEDGIEGNGVRVAVSDSGVDMDHPDLKGKMVNVSNDSYHTGGWIEFNSDGEPVESSTPHDTHGHGTHVSGTVVGGNASGTHIGVAPEAELMHALALPDGSGSFAQLAASLEWKAEPHDMHGNPLHEKYGGDVEEYRADVASMSWGAEGYEEMFEEPILNLKHAGVVPVAAIGNSYSGTVVSPAAVYEAFAVGASNKTDNIPFFSSGDIVEDEREDTPDEYVKPDFSAPGTKVKSAIPEGEWEKMSGTSMATPHVAGTVALMLEVNPYLRLDEIYEGLAETADYHKAGYNLSDDKNIRYGHGIINAKKAVDYISGFAVKDAENITRYSAKLVGEVLYMPEGEDEFDVFFRYREEGKDTWNETSRINITEPKEFTTKVDGLEKYTNYEYKVIANFTNRENTTSTVSFKTDADARIDHLSLEDLKARSVKLCGEITYLYIDKINIYFRYRIAGEDKWNETEPETIEEPKNFTHQINDLKTMRYYEYKWVITTPEDEEFTGPISTFKTPPPIPEWSNEEDAYLVTKIGHVQYISEEPSKDYILQNDITASKTRNWNAGDGFEPIGSFNGTLDGDGHEISDLYIDHPDENGVGLFRYIKGSSGKTKVVTDLGLVNADVRGDEDVGGFAGVSNRGMIENSYLTGSVTGTWWVGGLVGWNIRSTIEKSYAKGEVAGSSDVGGLTGWNAKGTIKNSYSNANITGGVSLGGIVGYNDDGNVFNSYATGDVNGYDEWVGGLVGRNEEGTVRNSYSTGEVSGTYWNVGGLVGWNSGKVYNSFWDIKTSGMDTSAGGTGKTTEEMKNVATYTETTTQGLGGPWEFVADPYDDESDEDIWNIDIFEKINAGYPFLAWQEEHGDYELTISIEGQSSIKIEDKKVGDEWSGIFEDGEVLQLSPLANDDWYFTGWNRTDKTGEEITIEMNEDKCIEATFESYETLTITEIIGNGTVSVDSEEVTEPFVKNYKPGEKADLEAVAEENWYFKNWNGIPKKEADIEITMDEDVTIDNASFEKYRILTIEEVKGEGAIYLEDKLIETPLLKKYEVGETVTLEAVKEDGWYFDGWTGDHESFEEKINITLNDDKNITANFKRVMHEISIDVEKGGRVTVLVDGKIVKKIEEEWSGEFKEGTDVTLIGSPESGFKKWEIDDREETENRITITIDEDKEISVQLVEDDTRAFTLTSLISAVMISIAIYKKKKDNILSE